MCLFSHICLQGKTLKRVMKHVYPLYRKKKIGKSKIDIDFNACTLVPTVFRWHGKKEFKCRIHFSFSHDIEKQIWILLFVFRFRPTLKNGFELRIRFLVCASLWKNGYEFRFSFSHYVEKRIWISFLVFSSLWKTDLNFVCRFCMTWKTDHCTSPVIWSPGHPLGVDRGIHFLCNWK